MTMIPSEISRVFNRKYDVEISDNIEIDTFDTSIDTS